MTQPVIFQTTLYNSQSFSISKSQLIFFPHRNSRNIVARVAPICGHDPMLVQNWNILELTELEILQHFHIWKTKATGFLCAKTKRLQCLQWGEICRKLLGWVAHGHSTYKTPSEWNKTGKVRPADTDHVIDCSHIRTLWVLCAMARHHLGLAGGSTRWTPMKGGDSKKELKDNQCVPQITSVKGECLTFLS